jgi:hypothetical protein
MGAARCRLASVAYRKSLKQLWSPLKHIIRSLYANPTEMVYMKAYKIALAVSALLAGPVAMATPVLPGDGPSDVFVVIFNSNTGSAGIGDTVIQALPDTVSGLPTTTTSFTIDTSESQILSDLGASSASDLSFAVVAGTLTTLGTAQYTSTINPTTTVTGKTQANGAVAAINSWLGNAYATLPTGSTSNVVAVGSANSQYEWTGANGPANPVDGTLSNAAFGAGGAAVGTSQEFYQSVASNAGGKAGSAVTTDLMGAWSYNLATDMATWTPSGGSGTVPLPAAAWLLMSGLVGFLGLGRRRAVRADDAAVA